MPDEPELRPYLRRLPIGERLPLGPVADDPLFPFDGEITVDALQAPTLPEPIRRGQPGGGPCPNCGHLEESAIWSNAHWVVGTAGEEPHGLPAVVLLVPRAHADLENLPPELAEELGVMIQRVARAVESLPDVGRVHVDRWGDGSEHFHLWFLARPRGMWQMRGAMLAVWDDLLPRVPVEEWRANLGAIAAGLAAVDGTAHLA